MPRKQVYKNFTLLFGIGILCLGYGLGSAYIENRFDRPNVMLSVVGFLCLLVGLLMFKKSDRPAIRSSAWRRYTGLVLYVILWGALLIGINYLALKYNLRWDVTQIQQHTLTESTVNIIQDLRQDVRIVAFYVGLPPKYLEDLFREYQRLSRGKVTAEIVDPLVQIGYAAQFGSVISGKEKKVIVQSSEERRDVDFTKQPLSEEQLTNAIIRVTRDVRHVYFLTGHGEYDILSDDDKGLSIFTKMLLKNNIESRRLMLGVEEKFPDDCDLLVVAGPQDHVTEKEKEIIQGYLEQGGDALFLIEHALVTTPDQPLTDEELELNPSLNDLFKRWGIRIANDIVIDLTSHASGDVGSPATRNYVAHNAIIKDLDYTFYIRPRSISVLGSRPESVLVAPLVFTNSKEKSWGETNRNLLVRYDDILDRPGPVPIAYAILEPKSPATGSSSVAGEKISDTRIIVFTDADFLTDAFIGQYSNAEMGLNVINWLSELDYQVFIDRKDIKIERLDLTSKQKRVVSVILLAMPLFIATGGMMVWMRQQNTPTPDLSDLLKQKT